LTGEGTKSRCVNQHGEHDGHSLSVLGWTRAGARPDERFDLIWVRVRQSGPAPCYRFVRVARLLLADDVQQV
jgi:hypothetical protein